MLLREIIAIWFIFSTIEQVSNISYNQPKLCANATWNSTAITFATNAIVGSNPYAVFVNTKNTIYAADRQNSRIQVWTNGNNTLTYTLSGGLNLPYSIFVNDNDEVFIDNGNSYYQVNKWISNYTNSSVPVMYMCDQCYGLFIDINNNLYCSMNTYDQVISKSLTQRLTIWNIVAGTGTAGSASTTLNNPWGLYVDTNLNLYVADSGNNRIQKFLSGQLNGITISTGSLTLSKPTSIAFDADGYLYIVDSSNSRIIGSGPNGFQCVVACSGSAGSAANQLNNPYTLSFDTYGNIFVMDQSNSRLQKFFLLSSSCNVTTTIATATISSTPSSITYSNGISFNQPKFGIYPTWNGIGITFANSTTVGTSPYGIFVNINNTLYVANQANSRIYIWSSGNSTPTENITGGIYSPYSLFVTLNGDIYVDNGGTNNRVDKWSLNSNSSTSVMYVKSTCYDLFIDINNNLYCSINSKHQVVMKSLNGNSSLWTVIAGTDCYGSTSNQLYNPRGIFVDTNLNLYVADCTNDRVQLFQSGQATATTIPIIVTSGVLTLDCPTDVTLDADGNLFIVDSLNNRIIGSDHNGFRCIISCSTIGGSTATQLSNPSTFSFDTYGNIYVTDQGNSRVQKFMLINDNNTYPLSLNLPNFCPSTTWYPNAITFADSTIAGSNIYAIYVSLNNTIYIANRAQSVIYVYREGANSPTRNISGGFSTPLGLYVSVHGDVYIDNYVGNNQITKWSIDTNNNTNTMIITQQCEGFFVDTTNTMYCALPWSHQVVKKWLNDSGTAATVVAGTGSAGGSSTQLYWPSGIYVDSQFNLYVADEANNRIQLFPPGQTIGITQIINGVSGIITLYYPHAITFDGNGYMFILETGNNRIIGNGPYGFRCVIACSGSSGSNANQLNYPRTFGFDSYGNMYVSDQNNARVQKFSIASNSCALSYNQPAFCSIATWTTNAITFASSGTIGAIPNGIFIDGINNIYIINRASNTILKWFQWSSSATTLNYINVTNPASVFVSISGEIYVDNGYLYGRVDKYLFNSSSFITVMNFNGSCIDLFIDSNNTLYCCVQNQHEVVKISLNKSITIPIVAAGNGTAGSLSTMLNSPQGIYVDSSLNLYIADSANNRVQMFGAGQVNGITLVGNGSSTSFTLNYPTDVVLDSNGYLFIVDSYNHRIVGSSSSGYRCVAACSGSSGSASNQLYFPRSMAFDSYGNIYVIDRNNSRVQQFTFQGNNCIPLALLQVALRQAVPARVALRQAVPAQVAPRQAVPAQVALQQAVPARVALRQAVPAQVALQQAVPARVALAVAPGASPRAAAIVQVQVVPQVPRQQNTTVITTPQINSNQTCYPPSIILIPGGSSLLSPISYRRSQDFSISSMIEFHCGGSLSKTTKWTVKNCSTTICSFNIFFSNTVKTTYSELYVPSRTLDYGVYELTLTVTLNNSSKLKSSSSAYVRITKTDITPNPVQLGTSMITRGENQDLFLDPGSFSIDPDQYSFDASKWKYKYYCRIYNQYNFPNFYGILLTIDDPTIDPNNPSCVTNRTGLIFGNSTLSPNSSLTILAGSLQSNQMYQFMVYMENKKNSSIQATGFVLVTVVVTLPKLIIIGCVIAPMCIPNLELQLLNPTTQVALYTYCVGLCEDLQSIHWNIYRGIDNSTYSNGTSWILFDQMNFYENIWFFGQNTSNFTASNQLFIGNSQINLWRFEVIYTFLNETSTSALNFVTNQSPSNGSCSINPLNGTTTTAFNISCSNWFDSDGIRDYTLYVWTKDISEKIMISYSSVDHFQVRLPIGNENTSLINLIVYIRDFLGSITQVNISSIVVTLDFLTIDDLFNKIQNSSKTITDNSIVQLLSSGNQNIVSQIIILLSQQLNQMNNHYLTKAISNGISFVDISISTLHSPNFTSSTTIINETISIEYKNEINSLANIRDYFVSFISDLLITTSNSIILQSSSLVQLTQSTNQLTRNLLTIVSNQCYQLSLSLYSIANQISYEDVQLAANQLFQCASNILSGVNGFLQRRTILLHLDYSRSNTITSDYDTDLESPWPNLNLFADENDFSEEIIEKNRNIYYQKQLSNEISKQVTEMNSLLSLSLNIHRNLGQQYLLNNSQAFLFFEKLSKTSLENGTFHQIENSQFNFPSNLLLNSSSTISIRV
ncbi:unnamed protein product [Adineta ricciae]|uniref:PKD/REJ-like domain-containing protein n=1 Tax=Adineta ricciae TaxID=249248 RepID=A0A815SV25_ADIRI|nr:unnamed protein product [Adineta ricciae]